MQQSMASAGLLGVGANLLSDEGMEIIGVNEVDGKEQATVFSKEIRLRR